MSWMTSTHLGASQEPVLWLKGWGLAADSWRWSLWCPVCCWLSYRSRRKTQSNTEHTDSAQTLYMKDTPTVKEINQLRTCRKSNNQSSSTLKSWNWCLSCRQMRVGSNIFPVFLKQIWWYCGQPIASSYIKVTVYLPSNDYKIQDWLWIWGWTKALYHHRTKQSSSCE